MMNFYGIGKTNSESELHTDSKTNKHTTRRVSNYELARGYQNINNNGIDRQSSFMYAMILV